MILFAYGSNMNPGLMADRCPEFRTLGVARLMDYRLCFPRYSRARNCATAGIEPCARRCGVGRPLRISPNDVPVLNYHEGYEPDGAAEQNERILREVTVLRMGGSEPVKAMAYFAIPDGTTRCPPPPTCRSIIDGANYHGLPKASSPRWNSCAPPSVFRQRSFQQVIHRPIFGGASRPDSLDDAREAGDAADMFYFAYGSNLDLLQMQLRCPERAVRQHGQARRLPDLLSAQVVRARLRHHQHRAGDERDASGARSTSWTARDLARLDEREGYDKRRDRGQEPLQSHHGPGRDRRRASGRGGSLCRGADRDPGLPSPHYIGYLVAAAAECGLPKSHLVKLAQHMPVPKPPERGMIAALLVFLGGGIGAAARHGVNLAAGRSSAPISRGRRSTVNVVGSFVMGLIAAWFAFRAEARAGRSTCACCSPPAFLGGFTTFSAFSLDAAVLWERGAVGSRRPMSRRRWCSRSWRFSPVFGSSGRSSDAIGGAPPEAPIMATLETRTVETDEAGMRLDRWFKAHYPELVVRPPAEAAPLGPGPRRWRPRQDQRAAGGGPGGARAAAWTRRPDGHPAGDEARRLSERDERLRSQAARTPEARGLRRRRRKVARRRSACSSDADSLRAMLLYEDDEVFVFNKPQGLAVQGGSGLTRHVDAMLEVAPRPQGPEAAPRPSP